MGERKIKKGPRVYKKPTLEPPTPEPNDGYWNKASTEGELKKQIDAIIRTPPTFTLSEFTREWLKKRLHVHIDDAKKDYPCYPICQKYTSDMMAVSKTDSGVRCDKGCFAWKEWFLKYFGDSS